jgi:hypothetical protein
LGRWLLLPGTDTSIRGEWRIRRAEDDSCWEVVYCGKVELRCMDRRQAARLANGLIARAAIARAEKE